MENYGEIAEEFKSYGMTAVTDIEIGYKTVLDLLQKVEGVHVLDYGCGVGKFTRILKDHGAVCTGVDIAPRELEIAKEDNPDISFCTVNEAKQEFDSSFDAAVLAFVITAIDNQEIINEVFKNIYTMLKPGGKLVMLNSNYEKSAERKFLSFSIGSVIPEIGKPLNVFLGAQQELKIEDYYYDSNYYQTTLERIGFEIETVVEPLAQDDNHQWKDETKYPPFIVISALKPVAA